MDPLFQDERISAYIDSQLPPDERSQFEDELARNSELRQIVEELRSLHDSLQALPRHRLGDDFAEHVLRRAERAMLSESHAGSNGSGDSVAEPPRVEQPAGTDSHVAPASKYASLDARRSRRPWIWAAIAIAVAVMLMVLNPPEKKQVKVAQLDSAPRAGSAERKNPERMLPEGKLSAKPSISFKRLPDLQSLAQEGRRSNETVDEKLLRNDKSVGAKVAPQSGLEPAAGLGERRQAEHAASRVDNLATDAELPAPQPAPPQETAKSLAGGPGNVQFREENARLADAPSKKSVDDLAEVRSRFAGGAVSQSGNKGAAADGRRFGEAAGAPHFAANGTAADREQSVKAGTRAFYFIPGEQAKASLPAGDMIVAECDTTSGASPAELQHLLEKRGITLNTSPAAYLALLGAVRSLASTNSIAGDAAPGTAAASGGGAAAADVSAAGKNADAEKATTETATVARNLKSNPAKPAANPNAAKPIAKSEGQPLAVGVQLADEAGRPPAAGVDDESLEVVYVVGTREQVLGLVDDLHALPAQYRGLAVATVKPEIAQPFEKDAKEGAVSRGITFRDAANNRSDEIGTYTINQPATPAALQAPPPPAAAPQAARLGKVAAPGDDKVKSDGAQASESLSAAGGKRERGAAAPPSAETAPPKEPAASKPAQLGAAVSARGGAAVAAPSGAAVPAPIVVRQKAADQTASTAETELAGEKQTGESAERSDGSGWAARMSLPPDAENLLRQSLAKRASLPADRLRQLRVLSLQNPGQGHHEPDYDKDSRKQEFGTASKQQGGGQGGLPEADGGASGDQVQAVFVFRLVPKTITAAAAAGPAGAAAAATPAVPPALAPAATTPAVVPAGKAGK